MDAEDATDREIREQDGLKAEDATQREIREQDELKAEDAIQRQIRKNDGLKVVLAYIIEILLVVMVLYFLVPAEWIAAMLR